MTSIASSSRSGKDHLLAAALVSGASQEEAAQAAGMSVRTAQRRMADEAFVEVLDALRRETVRAVADRLKAAATKSVETLIEMQDPQYPPGVRVRAATAVLDQLTRYQRSAEFDERLAALEAEPPEYIDA